MNRYEERSADPRWPRAALMSVGLLCLLSLAGCQKDSGSTAPDIVLVTIDTLRADRVGAYGHTAARTPTLDRLAREGALYDQCQAPVPVTLPSHATILTGLSPPRHGIRNNLTYELAEGIPTLAEALRRHGYTTGAFVGARPLSARFGLDRGFEVYDDRLPAPEAGESLVVERPAAAVVEAATDWVRGQDASTPIFLWVHFFEPHRPYEPPAPFDEEFAGDPYDGEVAAADAALGNLLDAVERARGGSRLTVVTSDHGEGLGQHDEATHALFLYQSTLRVPLIFHGPGRVPSDTVVDEPVGLVDVAPTILSFAGVDPRSELGDAEGIVLVPGRVDPPRRDLYAETLYPLEGYGWSPTFTLRHGGRKVIRSARSRAFDLDADPGETMDLLTAEEEASRAGVDTAPAGPAPPAGWAPQMLARLDSLVVHLAALGAAHEAVRIPTAQEAEALAALGYVGAGSAVGGEGDFLLRQTRDRPDASERLHEFDEFTRIEAELAGGRPGDALPRIEAILLGSPESAWAHWLMGRALFDTGQEQAALPHFQVALRLRPGWLMAQLNVARLLRRLDQPEGAIRAYGSAVELAPYDPELLAEAAGYLQQRGELDEARRLLQRGLESTRLDDAARGQLHGHLARLDLQSGHSGEGWEHLAAARHAAPSDGRLVILEALYLRQEGRWEDIVALFGNLDGELAQSGRARLELGFAQQMLGRLDEAVQSYEAGVALADTLDLAHNNLAWVLATERGRPEEALPHALRAIELAPDEAEYQDTYLEVLERLGRLEEARRHLRQVRPRFPSHPGLADRARKYGLDP